MGRLRGTNLFLDINFGGSSSFVSDITVADDLLFFAAADGVNGLELWVSDGTVAGTQLFQDINPGSAGSYPGALSVIGNQLFFTANDGTAGNELWVTTIPDNIIVGDDDNNVLLGTEGADLINGLGW